MIKSTEITTEQFLSLSVEAELDLRSFASKAACILGVDLIVGRYDCAASNKPALWVEGYRFKDGIVPKDRKLSLYLDRKVFKA